MLATSPTFDMGLLGVVVDEPSHIRFDIPAPEGEEDAHGESDHDLDG